MNCIETEQPECPMLSVGVDHCMLPVRPGAGVLSQTLRSTRSARHDAAASAYGSNALRRVASRN